MSCKYPLLFLLLCGFAALSVSETCGKELLEGTSCTIQLPVKNLEKSREIVWTHLSSGNTIQRKKGKIRKNGLDGIIEDDGSLTFERVSLKNTGKYKYSFYDGDGRETSGEVEIKVYAKAPKPSVITDCKDGKAELSCDAGGQKDFTVFWFKEDTKIDNTDKLLLTSAQVQEKKKYSCSLNNPISSEKSDKVTVSCTGTGSGSGSGTGSGSSGESSVPRTLFGFDFWIMVSILAGGGALLLLLMCVLIICACRSCKQKQKLEEDEDELRLRVLNDQNGTARSKNTARGQPAPPIPLDDPSQPSPTQTPAQPKAQTRGRPPPPPEDDEENPPPLPRPRNKQHRKRHEEPYRPME